METNWEHYKQKCYEIKKEDLGSNPTVNCIQITDGRPCKHTGCGKCDLADGNGIVSCRLSFADWCAKEYQPEPILDQKEHDYLEAVIRPFRNIVMNIFKSQSVDHDKEYIVIGIKNDTCTVLPNFTKNSMYEGMEAGKHYTLKELGL